MNATNQVPSDIATLIENRRSQRAQERQAKELEDQKKEIAAIEKGKAMYADYLTSCLENVPPWLHQYLNMPEEEINFNRISNGWDKLNMDLSFSIPGLSEISFRPEKDQWRAASARPGYAAYYADERREPYTSFRDEYWFSDLEDVLVRAKDSFEQHAENILAFEAEVAQHEARKAKERLDQERLHEQKILEQSERETKQQTEEHALFEAIKNDPVAIALVKAFIFVRDERSSFEEQVSDMDQSLYSMEEHWSRRAEELRRQADAAQRRAEDERSRLQDELDDAETKLKKAQRGY